MMKKMQRKWHVGKDWSVNFSVFIVYMYMHLAWYVQYSDWRRCVAIATRLFVIVAVFYMQLLHFYWCLYLIHRRKASQGDDGMKTTF